MEGRLLDIIFYDGECALCHGFVRWVLARDAESALFRFAPLQGETFGKVKGADERNPFPDSLVYLDSKGGLFVKSRAVLHVIGRLRDPWPLLGRLLLAVPAPIGDFIYDLVAGARHKIFGKTVKLCPVVPVALQDRFLP